MSKDFFESFASLSETSIENGKKVGAANLKLGEKALTENSDLIGAVVEVARTSAEKAAAAKDFQALAACTAEAAQECGQIFWNYGQSVAETAAEAGKFYSQLFEAGLKTASANANFAAPKAKARKSA